MGSSRHRKPSRQPVSIAPSGTANAGGRAGTDAAVVDSETTVLEVDLVRLDMASLSQVSVGAWIHLVDDGIHIDVFANTLRIGSVPPATERIVRRRQLTVGRIVALEESAPRVRIRLIG